ncbi:MAG: VOC family protein [Pseudomonadota bacterium]
MISYIKLGAKDLAAAKRFYDAVLPPLGYCFTEEDGGLGYERPDEATQPTIYVDTPFNCQPATNGNGAMIAFQAQSQLQVRTLHAAGIKSGGTDEGAPGFRAAYSPQFYVAYLRDPTGNKIALYSSNPDEPGRDD